MLVVCGIIFWLSATPNLKVSDGASDYVLRKTAHMAIYAALFLASYRALVNRSISQWDIRIAIGAALLSFARLSGASCPARPSGS